MSGRRGRNKLPVRRRCPSPSTTISISSDGDECVSTPSDGASSFAGPVQSGRPTTLHGGRRASTTHSPGSGTEQPSKKLKVEEIDLTQESSDESDEEQAAQRDGEGEVDMEEADEDDEESAGDEEDDPEDEDYTDRPPRGSRHRRTARPNVRTTSTDEGAQRRSGHCFSQPTPPSQPHMPTPYHKPRSDPAQSHRERSRSPLRFHNLAATHPGSPPPRDHYQASHQCDRQEYKEDEEAQVPHQSRHQGDADDATQAQGTSSRESQPQAFEDRAQSPHPAPATDDPSQQQQQQHEQRILELTRANQTLKRQHDRMVLQHSKQHVQLRDELDAVKVANERLVSKGLVDARQRRAAEAELVTVKATLAKSQMTIGTLRTMVQDLKRQVEDEEGERQSTQDEQRQQQQAHEQQQQQAHEQLQRQQQAREQQQQQQAEQAQAQAQARATARANLAAQFAQQQQHANQARQQEYMRRQAASGAAYAAGYASRSAQWAGPQGHTYPTGSPQQPFSQQYGSYQHAGPQHAGPQPTSRPVPHPASPPVPPPQPQHSATAAFATATPPVLDTTTRVHDLKLYLNQAGATEAMTRIHEKDELLALALTKANAWEIRRLVACSVVAHDPGFASTAQAQAFAYAAALRVPKNTLSHTAEGQAILQAAYKDLRIRVHPDKNPGDHTAATSAFQFLQQANNALLR